MKSNRLCWYRNFSICLPKLNFQFRYLQKLIKFLLYLFNHFHPFKKKHMIINITISNSLNAYSNYFWDIFFSWIMAALINSTKSIFPDSSTSSSYKTYSTIRLALNSSSYYVRVNPFKSSSLLNAPSPSVSYYLKICSHSSFTSTIYTEINY